MIRVIFILSLIFTCQIFAQVKATSKAGRLFPKKEIKTKKVYSSPEITIFSPAVFGAEQFETNKELIKISGIIKDEYGIKQSFINQETLTLLTSGEFYIEMPLSEGLNRFTIKSENINNKLTEEEIRVLYKPDKIPLPEILLNSPKLSSNNDFYTSEEYIIIAGNVKNFKDLEFYINSTRLTLNNNGDFSHELRIANSHNRVNIKATNKDNKSTELNFVVHKKIVSSVPTITIIEPVLPKSNILNHNETIITIRGKIEDKEEVRSIEVNNRRAALLGKNEFFANVNLNDGINNIVVSVTNIKGKSAEKLFKIITPVDDVGPEISILEPSVSRGLKIVRKKDVLDIKGKVYDRSGILNLKVNNREVSILPNNEFNAKLFLGIGNNTIVVRATDTKYNVTLDTFYVTRELEKVIKTGKYIALLVGINSYKGHWPGLRNAVNDARGLASVLKSDYHFDEVHTLIDRDATRKNIIKKFEWLINNSSRDDNVLIFYAGHGQFKRELNKGYWVPVDATSNSTADYISNSDIKTYLRGIPSKHTLLITDACFAGDIFRGSRTESIPYDPNNMTKYYREIHSKTSRLALTSGSLEQVSDAGKDNHSIFTYYLLKSLKENKQKYLDASQLFNDFRMAVTNNSDQTPQLQVVRDTNDEGGQFIFIKK